MCQGKSARHAGHSGALLPDAPHSKQLRGNNVRTKFVQPFKTTGLKFDNQSVILNYAGILALADIDAMRQKQRVNAKLQRIPAQREDWQDIEIEANTHE